MKKQDENDILEEALEGQIPEAQDNVPNATPEDDSAASYIGKSLLHNVGGMKRTPVKDSEDEMINKNNLTKIGENIREKADYREGWLDVDRNLLQGRDVFYPESWRFRIKPATVEAIRHWSTIDDENPNSVDDVFNEILKCCLQIITPNGTLSWGNINSWDRLFFLLLIREYTFEKGESKVEFEEECPNCDHPVTFTLNALSLCYDLPDQEVMKYYDRDRRVWVIDPQDFDVEGDMVELYVPTLDKDAAIKNWMISKLQNKKKVDDVFVRFAQWLAPKVNKDASVADKQLRTAEMHYKQWDKEMFAFMDSVIKNIIVTPSRELIQTCPNCGEEMTATIQFQDGIAHLFALPNRFKKFGSK